MKLHPLRRHGESSKDYAGPGFPTGERILNPVSLLDRQASIFHAVNRRRPEGWWGGRPGLRAAAKC